MFDFHWGQKQGLRTHKRSFHAFRFSPVSCSFELGAEECLPSCATVAACCLLPSRIKHGNIPQQTTQPRPKLDADFPTHTRTPIANYRPLQRQFPNMLPSLLLPVGSAVLAASSVLAAKCGRGNACSEDEPCCSRESPPTCYNFNPSQPANTRLATMQSMASVELAHTASAAVTLVSPSASTVASPSPSASPAPCQWTPSTASSPSRST